MEDSAPQEHKFEIAASIPSADLFARPHPAIDEGPAKAWEAAQTVIDFACALFQESGKLGDDGRLRTLVLHALLRRAIVTAEACYVLLSRGLLEPAIAIGRTLLDIELSVKLIHRDPTDVMAKRLAAYHYYAYQRHGQKTLGDRETREGTLESADRINNTIVVSKGYARMLEMPTFDDVRDAVKDSRYWHGHSGPEEAFKAIGQGSDYFMSYDSANWFVHAVNVDYDYVPRDDEQLVVKALVERDPKVVQTFLGHTVFELLEIIQIYVDERGFPDHPHFKESSELRHEDGTIERLSPLQALQALALAHFHSSEGRAA